MSQMEAIRPLHCSIALIPTFITRDLEVVRYSVRSRGEKQQAMDDPVSNELYAKLQANSGTDFKALKDKYRSSVAAEQCSPSAPSVGTEISGNKSEENKVAFDKLEKYKICPSCNGQGFVKTIYNHIVKQINCEACDGEAILCSAQAIGMRSIE